MRDVGAWLQEHAGGGRRVQKLSVSAGLTCPNRDGTVGRGGCTYCLNRAFTPSYADPSMSVTAQLEAGKQFFARRGAGAVYLAYFQSFSNTYAPLPRLRELYEEALSVADVAGLIF